MKTHVYDAETFSHQQMHEKQMSSNDQVGYRRMITDMVPLDTLTECNCLLNVPSKTHRIFQDRHSSHMRKSKTGSLLQNQRDARNVIEEALFSWVLHPSERYTSSHCVAQTFFSDLNWNMSLPKTVRRFVRTTWVQLSPSKSERSEMRPLYEIAAICLPSVTLVEQL